MTGLGFSGRVIAGAGRGAFARQRDCPRPAWLPPDEERRRRTFERAELSVTFQLEHGVGSVPETPARGADSGSARRICNVMI